MGGQGAAQEPTETVGGEGEEEGGLLGGKEPPKSLLENKEEKGRRSVDSWGGTRLPKSLQKWEKLDPYLVE